MMHLPSAADQVLTIVCTLDRLLTPMIFDVMARFRVHKVAPTVDIEKAFLNVAIAPEHRDYLRFLWVNDILTDNPQLVIMRFTRVVFGVNSSPFL